MSLLRNGCLALTAALTFGCRTSMSPGISERGTNGSLAAVVSHAALDSARPLRDPFLVERLMLGAGYTLDVVGARTDAIDAKARRLVFTGPATVPTVFTTGQDFENALRVWWPEDGVSLITFCNAAAMSTQLWGRTHVVMSRDFDQPQGMLVGDRSLLGRLEAPISEDLTSIAGRVAFWTIHPGGSTKVRCEIDRAARKAPTLSLEYVDSIPGMGFFRLGG